MPASLFSSDLKRNKTKKQADQSVQQINRKGNFVVTVACISFAFLEGSCSAVMLVQVMAGETEWYVVSLGGESGGARKVVLPGGLWDLVSCHQILPPPPHSCVSLGESLSHPVSIYAKG